MFLISKLSIKTLATPSKNSSNLTKITDQEIQQGKSVINAIINDVEALINEIEQASVVISALENDSNQIVSTLNAITDVPEKTELSTLNAAIEAAPVDEKKHEFVVVANKVRSLASRTQKSTEEIQVIIKKLQQDTNATLLIMSQNNNHTKDSANNIRLVSKVLEKIIASIAKISNMGIRISAAAEQQNKVAEEINRYIINVHYMVETTTTEAEKAQQRVTTLPN